MKLKTAPDKALEALPACLTEYVREHGQPPTLWELQTVLEKRQGVKIGTKEIHYYLEILAVQGKVRRLTSEKRQFAPKNFRGPNNHDYSKHKTV